MDSAPSYSSGASLYATAARLLAPPKAPDAWTWARKFRKVPGKDGQPVDYDSSRATYANGAHRACTDWRFDRTTLAWPGQASKSTVLQNAIGYTLDCRPAPCLYIAPTLANCQLIISPKLDQLISGSPLREKARAGHDQKTMQKKVGGVTLRLAPSGSAAEIEADPAAVVGIDEYDRCNQNPSKQGDLLERSDTRHTNFEEGRSIVISSPTEAKTEIEERDGLERWGDIEPEFNGSPIWRLFLQGTRHEYAVPCRHCREYFIPKSHLISREPDHAPLACPKCGSGIEQKDKLWMVNRGVYTCPGQSVKRYAPRARHAVLVENDREIAVEFGDYHYDGPSTWCSMWVSGLLAFASKRTFSSLARSLQAAEASEDPLTLLPFFNTKLGEPYWTGGEKQKWQDAYNLRGEYKLGELPEGFESKFVAMYTDVQKNRLYYTIRAYGVFKGIWGSSCLIGYGELAGHVTDDEVWADHDSVLNDKYAGLSIDRCGIDSGYQPQIVYEYCRKRRKCIATKGSGSQQKLTKITYPEAKGNEQVGIRLYTIAVNPMKAWIHNRIASGADGSVPFLLPIDVSEEYCKHLASEYPIVVARVVKWVQGYSGNHWWDCEIGCYWLARFFKRGLFRKKPGAESSAAEETPAPEPTPAPAAYKRRPTRRPSRGFVRR